MKAAHPYLNFPGTTEEAFNADKSIFGGEFAALLRFREMGGCEGMDLSAEDLDKIAHVALPLGGVMLMGTDSLESMGQSLERGNNMYISLEPDSGDEAKRLFEQLSTGGNVEMPLQATEWAEHFGLCTDRFGTQWMISYSGNKAA